MRHHIAAHYQTGSSICFQVFFGLPFSRGDRILTSQAEYGSNYLAYIQVRYEAKASNSLVGACSIISQGLSSLQFASGQNTMAASGSQSLGKSTCHVAVVPQVT